MLTPRPFPLLALPSSQPLAGESCACVWLQAAEEQLKALQAQIVQRGCKEEFQPDPDLMKDGKVSIWWCPYTEAFPDPLASLFNFCMAAGNSFCCLKP